MNEITTQVLSPIELKEKAIAYLDLLGFTKTLSPEQKNTFVEICQAYQLNPFKREIWAVRYKDDFNIIVGYETYLKRAERTGKLNGWKVEYIGNVAYKTITNNNYPKTVIDTEKSTLCAVLTIYRKDWEYPFVHEAYISEFCGVSPIWTKSPRFMLKKTVLSQGFRLCFSDDMGGMPYTAEETDTFTPVLSIAEEKPQINESPVITSTSLANALKDANRIMGEFSMPYSLKGEYEQRLAAAYKNGNIGELEIIAQELADRKNKAMEASKPKTKPQEQPIDAEFTPNEPEPEPEPELAKDTPEMSALKQDIIEAINKLVALGYNSVHSANSVRKNMGIAFEGNDWENAILAAHIPLFRLEEAKAYYVSAYAPLKKKHDKEKKEAKTPVATTEQDARDLAEKITDPDKKQTCLQCIDEILAMPEEQRDWNFIIENFTGDAK